MRPPHVLPPLQAGRGQGGGGHPQSQVRIAGLAWSGGAERHARRRCCGCSEGAASQSQAQQHPHPGERGSCSPVSTHAGPGGCWSPGETRP